MKGLVADLRFTKTFACDKPHYPFELPKGWEWTTLGEVISIKSGNAIKVRNNKNGSFPIYGGNGISGYSDEYNIDKPTIVIGRVGFYCGSIHYVKSKAWVTDNAFITSTYGNVYDIDFLYYLLTYCNLRQYSNSTAQPVISGKTIYPVHVPVPPIKEQRKIVEKIEFWLLCISQLEFSQSKVKSTIKQAKSKILDLAIHGKLVPQDPNDEPASELLKRINPKAEITCDNPQYGKLPDTWVWTTLGEITNYGDNKSVAVKNIDEDDWILELEDLEKDSADIIQVFTKKQRRIKGVRHSFKKGNILYSKLRTYLNKVLVAPKDGFCTTEMIAIDAYEQISNDFICYVLRSKYFVDYTRQCGYGVKMPRLSSTDACKGFIPLPPVNEQQCIVAKIEELFAQLDKIESSLQV